MAETRDALIEEIRRVVGPMMAQRLTEAWAPPTLSDPDVMSDICPRCGSCNCPSPDSKECSDNCIVRLQRENVRLRAQLDAAEQHLKIKEDALQDLGRRLHALQFAAPFERPNGTVGEAPFKGPAHD